MTERGPLGPRLAPVRGHNEKRPPMAGVLVFASRQA
ncbi:hypothetical protein SAMN05444340_11612 [Citreimonas salinaria]|uniref:Uncharacterized protein n=1 Tax=Citreimonas salinaria TaxID=321339 RepID=A0A1H3M7Y5_9RHOB|nr:hypothetical protein SAMN05444340_11612 [Citreimonas salinaria]